ncbi:class I tRNA ligase family protein, partial [uncultured Hyphomonas sp.]|uniref:class I tRNA ligase family protein n=1 Tax=uncultured Hyphomonas sp. TaxID=225298 RepID=UPI00263872C2
TAGIPAEYRGLDRFDARRKVVSAFEEAELLQEIENLKIEQPFGDRSNVVIEPWMTDQWYVDAKTMAKPAIAAVKEGKTKFVPENWEKTYYNWMENIQPWCISRQLWWGHRIPAWFGPQRTATGGFKVVPNELFSDPPNLANADYFVAETEEAALAAAQEHYGFRVCVVESASAAQKFLDDDRLGEGVPVWGGEGVLDTWFSSALWPFSTQGWPDKTADLDTFFPTATLVTAFDIIFFWVARMMMMSLEFMGEVPFKDVYIHALVLDEKGQKMSKSKGNAMDPLELVDEYGADALRFTMGRMAGQGRNIRLSKQAVEGNRNFATKLWNAARFAEMNECGAPGEIDYARVESPVNRWILAELSQCAAEVSKGIEDYKFNEAAGALYKFIWNTLCDWYLELIKPLLAGMDDAAKQETRMVCGYVLDESLKLLHPFMPFVTEELWERRAEGRAEAKGFLMHQSWPSTEPFADEAAAEEINWVIDMITELRSLRNDLGVPAGSKLPLTLVNAGAEIENRAMSHEDVLKRLARLEDISMTDATPEGAVTAVIGETMSALSVADIVDIDEARNRLDKELAQLDKDIKSTEGKLSNEKFVSRAPPEIVEENRERIRDWSARREKLKAARKGLEGL